jgi:hypothetical protein
MSKSLTHTHHMPPVCRRHCVNFLSSFRRVVPLGRLLATVFTVGKEENLHCNSQIITRMTEAISCFEAMKTQMQGWEIQSPHFGGKISVASNMSFELAAAVIRSACMCVSSDDSC